MAKQIINTNAPDGVLISVGKTANDRSGDPLRLAFQKANAAFDKIDANFAELYARSAGGGPIDRLINGDTELVLGDNSVVTFPGTEDGQLFIQGPEIGNTQGSIAVTSNNGNVDINVASTVLHSWQFANGGTLRFPNGAGFGLGESGQLKVNDGTTASLDFRDTSGRGFYTNSNGYTLRSNGTYNWKFGTDGRTTLPAASAPTHSYGAPGDKAGMTVVNGDYIYYCEQDYVDNMTNIWVRSAWTGNNW